MFNVSPVLQLLAFALLQPAVNAKFHEKTNGPNCQTFSQGVNFNETDAIGTWHLLHYRTENSNGTGDPHCMEFTPVSEQERRNLEELVGIYVENINWETITLKMQFPCKNGDSNKTRDYYLERLEANGSYRTLHMAVPKGGAKFNIADFHRYPMRLKIIEGQYLGMMDCHDKLVFILGKQRPEGKETDDRFQKMIDTYWPEEN